MSKMIEAGVLESFLHSFHGAKKNYSIKKEQKVLLKNIEEIVAEYHEYFGIGDVLLSYGEELIIGGDRDTGRAIFRIIEKGCGTVANQTLLILRLAEEEFENGNTEEGKKRLLFLYERVDNVEQSIKINELCDVFERYKHFIEGEKCCKKEVIPLPPNECSMLIGDILELSEQDMLLSLSEHISELSANGQRKELLSEQELNVYLIDEFIQVINSDGLENYFSYCSENFLKLYSAFSAVRCTNAQRLWEKIKNRLSSSSDIDPETEFGMLPLGIDTEGINFEKEERFYYSKVEEKLLSDLYRYVIENAFYFK